MISNNTAPIQALIKPPIWWIKNTNPNRVAICFAPKVLPTKPETGGTVDAPEKPNKAVIKVITNKVLGNIKNKMTIIGLIP